MKTLKIIPALLLLSLMACEKEIYIPPAQNTTPVCTIEIHQSDLNYIKQKIEEEPFQDAKFQRGVQLTKNQCFATYQVIQIIDLYAFSDEKLEMAKILYHQTIDQHMYYDVVDQLAFKSDRDELARYIETH